MAACNWVSIQRLSRFKPNGRTVPIPNVRVQNPITPFLLTSSIAAERVDQADQEDEQDEEDLEERQKMYTVIVSIKSFLKFLNAHSVSTTTIACKTVRC